MIFYQKNYNNTKNMQKKISKEIKTNISNLKDFSFFFVIISDHFVSHSSPRQCN